MRGVFIFLLCISIFLIPLISSETITGDITGEVITGDATAQTNVNLSVNRAPVLIIYSPENRTYNSYDIRFNFTASDGSGSISGIWYNLNNGVNQTITGNITITGNAGNNTLNLFANDTQGNPSNISVKFYINYTAGYIVNTSKYNTSTSTNFTYLREQGREYLENITNLTLEIPSYGKIKFNTAINISQDIIDDETDANNLSWLDEYSDISDNSIYIDSNYLSFLNTSATLYFYNLDFTNPRILRDGSECPETICTLQSYSSGTLVFNVTHFTTYSSEEIVSSSPTPEASSGGSSSGGSSSTTTANTITNEDKTLEVTPEKLKSSLKQGETKAQLLTITNLGDKRKVTITAPEIENLIQINERSFELQKGESKTIKIDFLAPEDILPDLYQGEVIIQAGSIQKRILTAIDISSKKALFDVLVVIPKSFETVAPGGIVSANIRLFELQTPEQFDIKVTYSIKNLKGEVITSSSETLAIENQANFIKSLSIPENTEEGVYLFHVEIEYQGEKASSSEFFNVGVKEITRLEILLGLLVFLLVTGLAYTFYELQKIKKSVKPVIIKDETLIKVGAIKRNPLRTLSKAFKR